MSVAVATAAATHPITLSAPKSSVNTNHNKYNNNNNNNESTTVAAAAVKLKEEGNRLFMKRNFHDAIVLYTGALEKQPNTTTFLTNRALCYIKTQQWTACVEDCRRAIEIAPQRCVKAHFYLVFF